MEEVYDENDLLLDGSPLAQYLNEIGVDEFASFSSNSKFPISAAQNDRDSVDSAKEGPRQSEDKSLSFMISRHFSRNRERKDALLNCTRQCLLSLQESSLWEDIDIGEIKQPQSVMVENYTDRKPIFTILMIIALQISVAVGIWADSSRITMTKSVLFIGNAMILLFTIVFALWQEFMLLQTYACCTKASKAVESMVATSNMYCKILEKSILLIREFEVVAMGLTYYHPNLPQMKSGLQKRGMCWILRKFLLENTITGFTTLQTIATTLIKLLPKDVKLFYDEDSISHVSILDIKSSLNINDVDEKNFIETDVLTSLVCLNKTQLTEIMQIFALMLKSFSDENLDKGQLRDFESSLRVIGKTVSKKITSLKSISEEIQSRCNFTKENEFKFKSVVKQNRLISPLKGDLAHLMTRIDSATLHLKSSLDRLKSIEDLLQECCMPQEQSNGIPILNHSDRDNFKELIAVFSHDVDGAKTCMEDLEGRLLGPMIENKDIPDGRDLNDAEEISLPRSLDLAILEPEGDLLLEGISEPPSALASNSENETSLSEQKKLKKEIRESKRLMSELKAIFSMKKSPIGLVPFELLKESPNLGPEEDAEDCDNHEYIQEKEPFLQTSKDAGAKRSCEQEELLDKGTNESNENFSCLFGDDCPPYRNIQSKHIFSIRDNYASGSMFSDLATAIKERQNEMHLPEQTLEADTYSFSDHEYEE